MPGPKLNLIKKDQTDNISFSISFTEEMLKVVPTPYGFVLQLEDYQNSGELGGPALPSKVFKIALPANTQAGRLVCTAQRTIMVGDEPIFIAPVQPLQVGKIDVFDESAYLKKIGHNRPFKIDREGRQQMIQTVRTIQTPIEALYKKSGEQPKPFAVIVDTIQMGTVDIVNVEINPVRYTKEGRLEFVTELLVEVFYVKTRVFGENRRDDTKLKYMKSIRTRKDAVKLTNLAQMLVINPDSVIDFSHLFPQFIGSLDYLIITDNQTWNSNATVGAAVGDLKSVFQRLADWKKLKGLKAHVVTVEEIVNGQYGNFSLGANGLAARDLQEIIRNFLKWALLNWGISWVLLGGDVDIIPVRQVPGASEGQMDTATANPPVDNKTFWTGSFLKMNVVGPGTWWPGNTGRILVRPDSGTVIPFDATGTSNSSNPGWYYCTSNTYATRTTSVTQFVRANGPASLLNASLKWIYEWNNIPTDLYYASLEGTSYNRPGLHDWDLTNNGIYGQHNDESDFDGDVYDTDVSVGRVPASSVSQAEAFVNKLIAYENFREPDGTLLNLDWPRKLTLLSSNWGGRFGIDGSATNPPGDRKYFHQGGKNYTIINTMDVLEEYHWRLIVQVSETDLRYMPYNFKADATGYGWFFANGPADPTPSGVFMDFWMFKFNFPIPTKWIAVYGSGNDLTPQYYIFDTIGADGSMADQEILRKQLAVDLAPLNLVTRLYEDEVDLPAADAAFPTIQHLTDTNVRNSLNQGPAIVSLSGHGNSDGCCYLNGAMAGSLTNKFATFIAFADSCLTNQFEANDAMSEMLLLNPNGGAVGYVGNTRFSWIGVGDNFQRRFFKTLTITRHLGHLNDVRTTMVNESTGYYRLYNKWVIFAQNLLGDPEMEIWTKAPNYLDVSHLTEIYTGSQNFKVTVKKDGALLANANVSLKINNGSVINGKTNGAGLASININPTAIGSMRVVVTAANCIPYSGNVDIKKKGDCSPMIACGPAIICGPAVTCGVSLACTLKISCGLKLACGNALNACSNHLVCQPMLGHGEGCPNILPADFDKFKHVLDRLKFVTFTELAERWEQPEVRRLVSQLPPDQLKELNILIDRIRAER